MEQDNKIRRAVSVTIHPNRLSYFTELCEKMSKHFDVECEIVYYGPRNYFFYVEHNYRLLLTADNEESIKQFQESIS